VFPRHADQCHVFPCTEETFKSEFAQADKTKALIGGLKKSLKPRT
jgi:hypothetical protein